MAPARQARTVSGRMAKSAKKGMAIPREARTAPAARFATSTPRQPPTPTSSTPSKSSNPSTRPAEKPMARKTAISVVRSRMAVAMVLPVTMRMATTTAAVMPWMMAPMLPSIFTKLRLKAFSVSVRVS